MDQPTGDINAAVDAAIASIHGAGFSAQSQRRLTDLVHGAANWLGTSRIVSTTEVDRAIASRFIASPVVDGQSPSVATMHLRRSGLRLLFRACRAVDLCDSDPTLDIALPSRSGLTARPLTDDEIVVCRGAALGSLVDTRIPAAWALAEATATTSELPVVVARDLDDDFSCVRLPGSSKRDPRVGALSGWSAEQLQRRVRTLAGADEALVYLGKRGGESGQASTCKAIHQVLVRAGLGSEGDVRPSSVAAWAGRQIWNETARIEAVARGLGLRSLDRAARVIAWRWRESE